MITLEIPRWIYEGTTLSEQGAIALVLGTLSIILIMSIVGLIRMRRKKKEAYGR